MCVVAFAVAAAPEFTLTFAANRDELHARPTAAADWWADAPDVLGGRDLIAGGSWLAVTRAGRLAAVTNLPTGAALAAERSRGALVREFLMGDAPAEAFFGELTATAGEYAPFNFLAFDGDRFHYYGSDAPKQVLGPGYYALSNAPLGSTWPKIGAARRGLREALGTADPAPALFDLLAQGNEITGGEASSDAAAPAWRQSRLFIRDPVYGTRSSTVILLGANGRLRFIERSFDADGRLTLESEHEFVLAGAVY